MHRQSAYTHNIHRYIRNVTHIHTHNIHTYITFNNAYMKAINTYLTYAHTHITKLNIA